MAGTDGGKEGGKDGGIGRGTGVVFSLVVWRGGGWTDATCQKWCQLPHSDGLETLRLMCMRAVTPPK